MKRYALALIRAAMLACLALFMAGGAAADVRLPRLLSDGMILQRDAPVRLWGWAGDDERIEVFLDGRKVAETRAESGAWSVRIEPLPAGGPHEFVFAGDDTVTVGDVWFGDVWLAAGQSNMELPMSRVATRYPDVIPAVAAPMIREFAVPKRAEFDGPLADIDGGHWQPATPDAIPSFSAIGYFFAQAISERYDVPVGIIKNAYGGSAAESWLSEEALRAWPDYLETATRYRDAGYLAALQAADREASERWHAALDAADDGLAADPPFYMPGADDSGWSRTEVPGYWAETPIGARPGAVWFRRTVQLPEAVAGEPGKLTLGRIVNADTAWVNGTQVGATSYEWPPRIYAIPEGVLKDGANSIAVRIVDGSGRGGFVADKPYRLEVGGLDISLEGSWRYRLGASPGLAPTPKFVPYNRPLGFYNAMLAPLARLQLKGVLWYQGESNVGRAEEYAGMFKTLISEWRKVFGQDDLPFLYVQLANYLAPVDAPGESDWAELREAQRAALALPHTAMVVAIDAGEWNDIHPLDKQTIAKRLVLAARKVAYGEPGLVASGPIPAGLRQMNGGLEISFDSVGKGLVSRREEVGGFAVAGRDGGFEPAEAVIEDNTVFVSSDAVPDPVRVRYAWADNPVNASLYNEEGLPATPFELSVSSKMP